MSASAETVSQETRGFSSEQAEAEAESKARFLQAWKDGVEIAGPSLFCCQARSPRDATSWRQLTPKLDVMRKQLPNRGQVDAVFAAAMASHYNAEEGRKLLIKVGAEAYGGLLTILDRRRRAILATLMIHFGGW